MESLWARRNGGRPESVCTLEMCFTLYSSDDCAYCRKAKGLLDRKGLRYRSVDLTLDEAGREELVRRTGRMSFPQVFVDSRQIGGYDELELFIRSLAGLR